MEKNCLVGANSLVNKNLKTNSIVAEQPSKIIKSKNLELIKNNKVMIWKSLGIIFNPKSIKSIKSHSWVPTVIKYKRDKARVFLQEEINLIIAVFMLLIFL